MDKLTVNHIKSIAHVSSILFEFDNVFVPSLSTRIISLDIYAKKIVDCGDVYTVEKDREVLGFVAFYLNDYITNTGYLAQIAIKPDSMIKGISYKLIKIFENKGYENGMKDLKLEVDNSNKRAINFYKKNGYRHSGEASDNSSYMMKRLTR